MPDVIGALVRQEESEGRRHQRAHVLEGARADGAYERLQFGECQFDRIEVWAVGWQKAQEGARLLNRGAHLRLFVSREIVEHDDIARAQGRDQDLLDVGAERVVVDRSIEHGCGGQFRGAERRDDRVRLPVAARGVIRHACAARTARVPPQQIRRNPGFIDEDVLPHIVERQGCRPAAARRGDVRTPLFVGVDGFF